MPTFRLPGQPPDPNPHELTPDEQTAAFFQAVWQIIDYWSAEPYQTPQDRCEGVAHSLLSLLDGEVITESGYLLVPRMNADDQAFAQAEGLSWYPLTPEAAYTQALPSELNDLLYHYEPVRPTRRYPQ